MNWVKVLNKEISLEVMTNSLPTKGNLVYEYNPFRNYRLTENKYYYKGNYYTEKELEQEYKIAIYKNDKDEKNNNTKWINSITKEPLDENVEKPVLYEKGLLIDFITDELLFSLDHPVHIVPLYSYDGSVNLIINDGINIPRLINSRFSATGRNTYEIVDRKGNNDTNIYDLGEQFDIDTSLYKRIIKIPRVEFKGTSFGGNLKVGNYHFYFKLSDADGNETDFVEESGLVSVFIGFNDPDSIHTGLKNENSFKLVEFQMSNIDTAYDNVFVYYSRYTAEGGENFVTEYCKVNKKFIVNSFGVANISITGFEEIQNITASEINLSYNIVDSAKTSATCQNMLFLGNVHKPEIPYKELADLSLRFLPYLKEESYPLLMNQEYLIQSNDLGYYDSKFIYDKTGYWPNEIYRFGVVYIMPNNELTPVFNIRGANGINSFNNDNKFTEDEKHHVIDELFTDIPIYNSNKERVYINYNEENFKIISSSQLAPPKEGEETKPEYEIVGTSIENVKGVCKFEGASDKNTIYGLDIRASKELIDELKKYVKGYFFVRQTRIPTILAQGVTMGIDKVGGTPCLPTAKGIIDEIDLTNLDRTYLETKDLDDVNYISEGFMNRYSFSLERKGGFMLFLSGIILAFACVCSFIPGIGTTVNAIIQTASFALTTALTGKFLVGAFISAVTASIVPAVKALLSMKAIKEGSKLWNTLNKIRDVVSTTTTIGDITTTTIKTGTMVFSGIATGIEAATNLYQGGSTIVSSTKGRSYNGRNTEIPSGFKKVETSDSRKLGGEFHKRIIIKDPDKVRVQGIICPDYTVNQAYYNQIFTGNKHLIRLSKCQGINYKNVGTYHSNYFTSEYRHFYHPDYFDLDVNKNISTKIIGVPGDVKAVGLSDNIYRSRAGEAEEAWRYLFIGKEYEDSTEKQENTDIIRGCFSPYLAVDTEDLEPATIVDIMIPEYSDAYIDNYFYIRMIDNSVFSAISRRYEINDLKELLIAYNDNTLSIDENKGYKYELYRGDCYICQFTQRIFRNFNDPSAPYNDDIVDESSWKDNYNPDNTEKYSLINLGDVNAVLLGMWVTFKLRSSNNLNIRTLDGSNVDEKAMTGHERGFYPYHSMITEGTYKHPEAEVYNKGFTKSVGERWNFELPDVPYIKNWFGTRIMYSDVHVNDAYKNGYRVFQGTHYRDYTREYGEIVKLISLESKLLVVFEHGIALIDVNERALAGNGAQGNIYINTSNVLPENPKIISDSFGSQWPESIIKVPKATITQAGVSNGAVTSYSHYVYGVDTVAKKIWRTDGSTFTCISDFKVQEFLNNNITLGERELTPKIGIRNVKTVYNAYKRDVMFTFYDNTYGFEEKVWNLCWNELLLKFITFYSWVPSYMENINNIPFSFNRDTSKWIAKLGTSHADNSFADGITLSNVIINNTLNENNEVTDNFKFNFTYITKSGQEKTMSCTVSPGSRSRFIGVLSLSNRTLPDSLVFYTVDYELVRDSWLNYRYFTLEKISVIDDLGTIHSTSGITLPEDAMYAGKEFPIWALMIKEIEDNYHEVYYLDNEYYYTYSNQDLEPYRVYTYMSEWTTKSLLSELYYRNQAGNAYADDESNKIAYNDENSNWYVDDKLTSEYLLLPIYKSKTGKRINLPEKQLLNPDKIVTLLNIRANISISSDNQTVTVSDDFYNLTAGYEAGTSLVDAGYYESVVAITPKWNLQFLSTDFWKHGQAGLIDIADDIYPTYWYGKQHPFEFECIVVNDPSTHKIFSNLELVANKAKPESFHYEIIGECYDFAKDKVNMYFRQEAMKALWLYNGEDITYDRNFLKVQPVQLKKSADFPHVWWYGRQDRINEIEDSYNDIISPKGYDHRHLSGAEIVYYPTRQEYRIWQHCPAVDVDNNLSVVTETNSGCRGLIAGNMTYLEDRWKVTINPIIVCYKNEYDRKKSNSSYLFDENNSTWATSSNGSTKLPSLPIYNSPIPDKVKEKGDIEFPDPDLGIGKDNALYNLYKLELFENGTNSDLPLDTTNWLNDVGVYQTNFGESQNRKEIDLKDKFMKVRIRYSGEELAVIDFLNTIYRISYT